MSSFAPLSIAGLLVAAAVTVLVREFTTSAVWAVGVGVTVGVLWMLLCAYTVAIIQARRRHDPTSNGEVDG